MTEDTINWQTEVLENDLTRIRPLAKSDFDELFEVASDPLIWEQHPSPDRYKKEIFQIYFDGAIQSGTAFIILDKSANKIIGSTRYYDYKKEDSSVAIGYTFLVREYWGGLYNKSSKKLLLDHAFRFVNKVYFHIGTDNMRSQKAILNIGAVKVGEADFDFNGKMVSHYEYVIQKNDWLQHDLT